MTREASPPSLLPEPTFQWPEGLEFPDSVETICSMTLRRGADFTEVPPLRICRQNFHFAFADAANRLLDLRINAELDSPVHPEAKEHLRRLDGSGPRRRP
jgi:hypothetical protein